MNVCLTYNVKPEENSSHAILSSFQKTAPDNRRQGSENSAESFNDLYAEWDSAETIEAVRSALSLYHNVTLVEADFNAFEKLRTIRPDIVFNIAEGINGISRESQIPAMLDMLGIPYSGSDPLTLATCLDKSRTKEILSYHNINNPEFIAASSPDDLKDFSLKFPVIVKPSAEGSSKGIFNSSFVDKIDELKEAVSSNFRKYNQPSLIEEYLPGREFTVAIVGNEDAIVLPIVEINFSELPEGMVPIYSYEAKWIADTRDNPLDIFTCPAEISPELKDKIETIALKTYRVLGCKDWSRIDVRLDSKGEPAIIEVNPLPGILPNPMDNSCFPKAARAYGWDYNEMLNRVLYAAMRRYKLL